MEHWRLPDMFDDSVIQRDQAWAASIRCTRHIQDFSRWKEHDYYQEVFKRLLRDLKAELNRGRRSLPTRSLLYFAEPTAAHYNQIRPRATRETIPGRRSPGAQATALPL